jgi:hypothetical protein
MTAAATEVTVATAWTTLKTGFGRTSREPAQGMLSGKEVLGTTRQAAAGDFLLARLVAAFLAAAFTPTLRPRPSDFAKSDRCAA